MSTKRGVSFLSFPRNLTDLAWIAAGKRDGFSQGIKKGKAFVSAEEKPGHGNHIRKQRRMNREGVITMDSRGGRRGGGP